MGKILGSWSGMRKYLEQEMLADSLKGRIRYGCTRYVGMDTCHIFEVCIDGVQVKRFSWETVNTYFINNGFTQNHNPSGMGEYWAEFWELLEKYSMEQRTEYTDEEFCEALEAYRNQDIQESIDSRKNQGRSGRHARMGKAILQSPLRGRENCVLIYFTLTVLARL